MKNVVNHMGMLVSSSWGMLMIMHIHIMFVFMNIHIVIMFVFDHPLVAVIRLRDVSHWLMFNNMVLDVVNWFVMVFNNVFVMMFDMLMVMFNLFVMNWFMMFNYNMMFDSLVNWLMMVFNNMFVMMFDMFVMMFNVFMMLPGLDMRTFINLPISMRTMTLSVEVVVLFNPVVIFLLSTCVFNPVSVLLTNMSIIFVSDNIILDSLNITRWLWWSSWWGRASWWSDRWSLRTNWGCQVCWFNTTSVGLPVGSPIEELFYTFAISSVCSLRSSSISGSTTNILTSSLLTSQEFIYVLITLIPRFWFWNVRNNFW